MPPSLIEVSPPAPWIAPKAHSPSLALVSSVAGGSTQGSGDGGLWLRRYRLSAVSTVLGEVDKLIEDHIGDVAFPTARFQFSVGKFKSTMTDLRMQRATVDVCCGRTQLSRTSNSMRSILGVKVGNFYAALSSALSGERLLTPLADAMGQSNSAQSGHCFGVIRKPWRLGGV